MTSCQGIWTLPAVLSTAGLLLEASHMKAHSHGVGWSIIKLLLLDNERMCMQDITATIMAAAQPNLVTAAALRVLQNPRLHKPPPQLLTDRHSQADKASSPNQHSNRGPDELKAAAESVQLAQQRWKTKDALPSRAGSGSVTSSSISLSRRDDSSGAGLRESTEAPTGGDDLSLAAQEIDESSGATRASGGSSGSGGDSPSSSKWKWRPRISLTKLHGISPGQAARGQKHWLGIRCVTDSLPQYLH